ncbi:MAG: anaerobic sulfite reductase subunit AsrA [Coriobacteriia bacterium]|nr:anaerobic sulfite reductase subunit AsrA [Coriobacteriia bacterium]
MKIKLGIENFNKGLEALSKDFRIFAPKRFEKRGTHSDTDVIRYGEVSNFEEMVLDEKSDFSPKETILPINEVLFYFTEDQYRETSNTKKPALVFLRACDLHGVKRIDQMYLSNGPVDYYYKRNRDKVKFVLIGCPESFRNCFCVSMGCNKADNYDMGMNLRGDQIYLDIKDESLNLFKGQEVDFEVDYVKENKFVVDVPEKVDFVYIKDHEMWDEYDSRCIACGRCNFSCPTCTCFSMQDIFYKENENVGERRRVWASCQVEGYTSIAGGHSFRNKQGQRMRFKTLHKIHDFKERFGYNMCTGCGRCDDQCPQYISISTAIDKVSKVMKEKDLELD